MKKTYKLQNLGCANCAAKMEREIKKLDGVKTANINYMTSKLSIEAEDGKIEDIAKQASAICRKFEPDCKIAL